MSALEPGGTIAVTGVTSALGAALCRSLLANSYRVRGLLRQPMAQWNNVPDFTVVHGDLADRDALARLVTGADGVVHIAAMFRNEGSWEEFVNINVGGTERLLDASRAADVGRFVHCSTTGVHGSVADTPADEDAPFDPRDNYQRTKLMGEQLARSQAGQGGMEVVVIRPAAIYGVGDLRMLKLFRMLKRRVFVQIGAGNANFHPVFIDDLTDGFTRALTTPDIDGQTFILAGPEYLPLHRYIAAAAAMIDVPPPMIQVPYRPVEWLAKVSETVSGWLGVEPILHRRRLTFFKHNRAFSNAHARQRLGYEPRVGLEEGLGRMVAGYRAAGLL
ncbi:NAD-dependent epimerase/dehydratase family protein [Croceicoccus sp. F390]|uniref:NAD-dependent epimerase/dehydratase family protein n=1 Tax=Croceicoccus esteveae TaxID=3075597 RepID=A0ABU2ZK44_9SPHN|nr:NAD-dependent epimerase/dehydratase family protein [Croceicoccus sp. F390]MDT0576972.1 NAD-dependent epimerase/dehydratase family protein [Croceicoccus sp. F390]